MMDIIPFKPEYVSTTEEKCGCKYANYRLQLKDCGGEFEGIPSRLYVEDKALVGRLSVCGLTAAKALRPEMNFSPTQACENIVEIVRQIYHDKGTEGGLYTEWLTEHDKPLKKEISKWVEGFKSEHAMVRSLMDAGVWKDARINQLEEALALLLTCHIESANFNMSMLSNKEEFKKFLDTCETTVDAKVAFANQALQQPAVKKKEVWRYADELEQELKKLEACIKESKEQEPVESSVASEAYDAVDRYLRNSLDDDTYASLSEALECVFRFTPATIPPNKVREIPDLFTHLAPRLDEAAIRKDEREKVLEAASILQSKRSISRHGYDKYNDGEAILNLKEQP